jgi:CRP/FNR family transcriptional regulator
MIFKNARSRIQDFIVEFVKDFGKKTSDGYEAKNILTHADIAKLTATSRQTVSSTLSDLRKNNFIAYNDKLIKVPFSSPLLKPS